MNLISSVSLKFYSYCLKALVIIDSELNCCLHYSGTKQRHIKQNIILLSKFSFDLIWRDDHQPLDDTHSEVAYLYLMKTIDTLH